MQRTGFVTKIYTLRRTGLKPMVVLSRREAAQVYRVRQGVLTEQQPHHAHSEAHRLQALLLRPLRPGLPAQG
jgi:hypothetical protein